MITGSRSVIQLSYAQMPNPRTTDGAIEDLGVLLTAAYGLDTSWMREGSCYGWGSNRPDHPTPWQVAPGRKYRGLSGGELVKYALIVCSGCPAQYDCVTFAIKGMMIAGTWAVPVTHLRWLQKQDDAFDLIQMAKDANVPMQQVAVRAFAERGGKT
jgi:hypothetical protein